ncbi:MAG: hypothetical protein GWN71_15050, partial [Gammaproteobacteria bacterium]|nr:hypothetical protein [Actinomycetota bacterium]NIU74845.1 hypothetical protein [Gammaproteobacteria bacterium]
MRRRLLRRYRWNFAVKRATLAPESPDPDFGFDKRHMLPDDCLRVIGLHDGDEPKRNYTSDKTPFKVEGRFLHVDDDAPEVFYVADVTDTRQFDPMFDEALSWLLAWD